MASYLHTIGNWSYHHAYKLYRPAYLCFKRLGDRHERALLRTQVGNGDVVVDAGANIGVYSQFLSGLVGPFGAVHSFEPSPENYIRLKSITARAANIHSNQAAVGESSGAATLYLSNSLNVDHRTYQPEGEARATLVIRTVALDDYFPPNQRVDLIKLDIQGHELHALLGARRLIDANPEIKLLLEFWPHGLKMAGTEPADLAEFLRQLGLDLFTVGKGALTPFDIRLGSNLDESFYCNLFATRRR